MTFVQKFLCFFLLLCAFPLKSQSHTRYTRLQKWYPKLTKLYQTYDCLSPISDSLATVTHQGKIGLVHWDGRILADCIWPIDGIEILEGGGIELSDSNTGKNKILRPDGQPVFPKQHKYEEWIDESCQYASFETKKGFQLYDNQGALLCPVWFACIRSLQGDFILAKHAKKKMGLWNKNGSCIFSGFDWVYPLSDSIFQVQKGYWKGLLNQHGEVIFPIKSPFYVEPYLDSLFLAKRGGLLFNAEGNYVKTWIPEKSKANSIEDQDFLDKYEDDALGIYTNLGVFGLQYDSLFELVDSIGKVLWTLDCESIDLEDYSYLSGLASSDDFCFDVFHFIFEKNGSYGLVNIFGEVLLEAKYDLIYHENGDYRVVLKGKSACFDVSAKMLSPFVQDDAANAFVLKQNAPIRMGDGVFSSSYQKVLGIKYSNQFPSLRPWRSGVPMEAFRGASIPTLDKSTDGYCLKSASQNTQTAVYDSIVGYAYEPFYFVVKNGRVGLLDNNLQVVVPCRYASLSFQKPYVLARKGSKVSTYVVGDKMRKTRLNLFSTYKSPYLVCLKNGKQGLYDYNLNKIFPCKYDQVVLWENYIALRRNTTIELYHKSYKEAIWNGEATNIFKPNSSYFYFRLKDDLFVLNMFSLQAISLGKYKNRYPSIEPQNGMIEVKVGAEKEIWEHYLYERID